MKRILASIAAIILSLTVGALWVPSRAPAASSTTLPAFGHVVIVVGENTDYSSSYGGMTYLDSLANQYGLATNYYADTHPSIGNYLNLVSGTIYTNNDSDTPSSLGLSTSADNIAFEVQKAGKTWKDYEESTNGCGALNSGSYYVRHDPLHYFPNVSGESANFVCMSQFDSDVTAGTLPNFSYLAPNGCDDAHDCSLSTFDSFLQTYLPTLLNSKYFQPGGDGLLIVTFDENSGSGGCTTDGQGCGGQVETVLVSPFSKLAYQQTGGDPANSGGSYEEENMLRTIAQGLGASYSGLGAAATAVPMAEFFNALSGSMTISPTSLAFGNVAVGQTSAAKTLTLDNGTASAASLSIGITGTNAGEFSQTNTCGSSLASGASCTVSVTFHPTTAVAAAATLNTGVAGVTAALAGTGISVSATLSPTSLTFPSTTVGTTSAAQTSTMTNTGSVALAINSVAVSSNFAATDTCGSSLAAGAKCTISVTFKPTATGTLTGKVTVTTTPAISTLTISLTGTGAASTTPSVGLSPTSLTFPSTTVGTTSAAQTVTLKNTSTVSVSISSISATTPFAQTHTCGTSLASGASCTISVTFKPTAAGTATGTVSVADTASGSPQKVTLTGTGASPTTNTVHISPNPLTFPSTTVGSTSSVETATLTNSTASAVTITAPFIITGDYSFGGIGTCPGVGSTIAAGGSCTISVKFTPTASGTRTGTVTVTDSAGTQTLSLSGTGGSSSTGGSVSISPNPLTFPSTTVGSTSAVEFSKLTNEGSSTLTITRAYAITGDFAFGLVGSCPGVGSTVPAGGSCTISVKFRPTASGTRTGTVTVTDSAGTQTLSLTGTGASSSSGSVSISPNPLTFLSTVVGSTSSIETATLSNKGTSALTITSSFTISGDFSFGGIGTCPGVGSSIPAGGSCTISVKFTPTTSGTRTGTVTVSDSVGSQTLSLSGSATP